MDKLPRIGIAGMGGMGQNLALNVAEKGFPVSIYNRTATKVEETLNRAAAEGGLPVYGHNSPAEFVLSIETPRTIIILVKDGHPVDETIASLSKFMEEGDCTIDAGNPIYQHTESRIRHAEASGLLHLGMGISGGRYGARHGPCLMPGGHFEGYLNIEDILSRIAAQTSDGPCVSYIGEGGAGNYVEMIHNMIEHTYLQIISEGHYILKAIGGFSNMELADIFDYWSRGDLGSYILSLTADMFRAMNGGENPSKLISNKTGLLNETGSLWALYEAFLFKINISTFKTSFYCEMDEISQFMPPYPGRPRCNPQILRGLSQGVATNINREKLISDVGEALFASNVCSYAQALQLLKAKNDEKLWELDFEDIFRIWKGGCLGGSLIRSNKFMDMINFAFERKSNLSNILLNQNLRREMAKRESGWRRAVFLGEEYGLDIRTIGASLGYFDLLPGSYYV